MDVVMTRAALEFVGAITFEAVTGRRTYSEIFGAGNALDHIKRGSLRLDNVRTVVLDEADEMLDRGFALPD